MANATAYDGGDDDDAYAMGDLFRVAFELPAERVATAFMAFIGFIILFDSFLKTVEGALSGSMYRLALDKVYKELMIVGVISLGTAVLTSGTGARISGDTRRVFEYVNLVITSLALVFVVQCMALMYLTSSTKRRYHAASTFSPNQLSDRLRRATFGKIGSVGWRMSLYVPVLFTRDCAQFNILRGFFLLRYDVGFAFDFASYLNECLDDHVLSMMDVGPGAWLQVGALLGLTWLGSYVFGPLYGAVFGDARSDDPEKFAAAGFVLFGLLLLALNVFVVYCTGKMTERLLVEAGIVSDAEFLKLLGSDELETQDTQRRTRLLASQKKVVDEARSADPASRAVDDALGEMAAARGPTNDEVSAIEIEDGEVIEKRPREPPRPASGDTVAVAPASMGATPKVPGRSLEATAERPPAAAASDSDSDDDDDGEDVFVAKPVAKRRPSQLVRMSTAHPNELKAATGGGKAARASAGATVVARGSARTLGMIASGETYVAPKASEGLDRSLVTAELNSLKETSEVERPSLVRTATGRPQELRRSIAKTPRAAPLGGLALAEEGDEDEESQPGTLARSGTGQVGELDAAPQKSSGSLSLAAFAEDDEEEDDDGGESQPGTLARSGTGQVGELDEAPRSVSAAPSLGTFQEEDDSSTSEADEDAPPAALAEIQPLRSARPDNAFVPAPSKAPPRRRGSLVRMGTARPGELDASDKSRPAQQGATRAEPTPSIMGDALGACDFAEGDEDEDEDAPPRAAAPAAASPPRRAPPSVKDAAVKRRRSSLVRMGTARPGELDSSSDKSRPSLLGSLKAGLAPPSESALGEAFAEGEEDEGAEETKAPEPVAKPVAPSPPTPRRPGGGMERQNSNLSATATPRGPRRFNNFDLDGKGRLNYHELRMLTRNLNIHMTYATFDFLFRRGAASILAIRARARAGDVARRARLSVGPSTRRWTTSSTSRSSATPCCRSSRPRPTRSPRARARGPSSTTSRRRSSAPRGRGPRRTGGRRRRRSPPPATGRGPRATAARAATSRSSRGRRRGRRTCCP